MSNRGCPRIGKLQSLGLLGLGHPLRHIDNNYTGGNIDCDHDGRYEGHLKELIVGLDTEAILGGTRNDLDDIAVLAAVAVDHTQTYQLLRPILIVFEVTPRSRVDKEGKTTQGFRLVAVTYAFEHHQEALFVGLGGTHRHRGWLGAIGSKNLTNGEPGRIVGQRPHDYGAFDPVGAPNVANLY